MRWLVVGLASLGVLVSGCPDTHPTVPECVPGMTTGCVCTDGREGAQSCGDDGHFGACVCSSALDAGPMPTDARPRPDAPADAARDAAPIVDAHVELDAIRFDAHREPFDAGPCLVPEMEWCDDVDNDCDSVVDEGEVCPDDTIAHTEPFTRGVWFLGTTSPASCGGDALQQFWPTLGSTYRTGFDCYGRWFTFRPSDDAIYYTATFTGVHSDVAVGRDPVVETPPCYDLVDQNIGFDATDQLYYECSETLRRGNGILVATDIRHLEAVLPSGRTVVQRGTSREPTFALLDVDGTEISRPDFSEWLGTPHAVPTSSSVQGESAWMLFSRLYSGARQEVVVMRVDSDTGVWSRVRRVPIEAGTGAARLALPDGRVFLMRADASSPPDREFVEYPPDGPMRVVWREADAGRVTIFSNAQFLVGQRL